MQITFHSLSLVSYQLFWYVLIPATGLWFGHSAGSNLVRNSGPNPLASSALTIATMMSLMNMLEHGLWQPMALVVLGAVLAFRRAYRKTKTV